MKGHVARGGLPEDAWVAGQCGATLVTGGVVRSPADGGDVTPTMRSGLSVYQNSHDLLCQVLQKTLVDVVQAGHGAAGGIGSIEYRAVATLYVLLMDHPIDRRSRCQSCRRLGAIFGSRWRRCRVYGKASVWLHQPDEALLLHLLVDELELAAAPPLATDVAPRRASACDPDATDMLPTIAADGPTKPLKTPVVSPTPTAQGGMAGFSSWRDWG